MKGFHNINMFCNIKIKLFRHGDNGNYLFFSTTALKLSNTDTNIDVENLGNSTLVTFMIITMIVKLLNLRVESQSFHMFTVPITQLFTSENSEAKY